MTRRLDLTKPSVQSALHFAQQHGTEHMIAAGRLIPTKEDTEVLQREFARLLWHVPVWDGGFCHGDDAQVCEVARRWGLTDYADKALPRMGSWPVIEQVAA